ncbi:MAG: autotransporter domain-containing protein, partial [Fusobacterium periodonticum]|nr:autotransporter domain-containing protein [Fusobacterium periodonticum]
DLIIGTEATKYTTSKYIQLGQDIIEPYNDMIRTSGIEKWNIYSGSLTWMASITQLPDFTIRNAYLAKIPYTVFAGNQASPVAVSDTYNFLDGLEQRYGVEEIGTRENKVFQKLNSIGNNEEILFHQATDEMMGHQYANTQQRIQSTGSILDKEFKYLRKEWSNPSKDANKIKTFGTNGE